eukprot:TRINITY_DN5744_c0_g1_i1.p2 TRINITY_DN5744_c0_g1~~TRINITY_DN5744_c0_g1_i1.p2  ORF type:complete len:208 (-),score=79.49 TRINITY_DN5744_c0_g1_i1:14-577(-)
MPKADDAAADLTGAGATAAATTPKAEDAAAYLTGRGATRDPMPDEEVVREGVLLEGDKVAPMAAAENVLDISIARGDAAADAETNSATIASREADPSAAAKAEYCEEEEEPAIPEELPAAAGMDDLEEVAEAIEGSELAATAAVAVSAELAERIECLPLCWRSALLGLVEKAESGTEVPAALGSLLA